jgi:hypothetical protein
LFRVAYLLSLNLVQRLGAEYVYEADSFGQADVEADGARNDSACCGKLEVDEAGGFRRLL